MRLQKDWYYKIFERKSIYDVKIKLKDNKPIVNINLSGEARIIEVKGDIDLEDYKVIEKLQKN